MNTSSITWTQKIRKNGIRVFTKPNAHSPFDYFRAVSIFPFSYQALNHTLLDIPNWPHWLPKLYSAQFVHTPMAPHATDDATLTEYALTAENAKARCNHPISLDNQQYENQSDERAAHTEQPESDKNDVIVYGIHRARPLKDRDYYLRIRPFNIDAQGTAFSHWQMIAGPKAQNFIRIDNAHFHMILSSINENGHRFEVTGHLNPGGRLKAPWFNRRLPFLVYRTLYKAHQHLANNIHDNVALEDGG